MEDVNLMVMKWAQKIGPRKAVARLYEKGVSARVAELLCQGRYAKNPGDMLLTHIENAMSETLMEHKAKGVNE